MKKTYQPFILKICEQVFEEIKDDIKSTDRNKETLCNRLTQKFIDGKLSEGDQDIFDSDEEIDEFVNLCLINDDLDHLHELGLIGSYNDGESYFLTEEGKLYTQQLLMNNK